MKKFLQNVLLRSLCVLIFGILLLAFSSELSRWIVYASGALFLLLGVIALVGYVRNRKEISRSQSAIYPVIAIGSLLFGLVQLILPDQFYGVLRYLMAGIIFLLALGQLYSLFVIRRGGAAVKWFYFVFPLIGIGVALFVTLYEGFVENDSRMMVMLGVVFVLYALVELWSIVLVRRTPVVQEYVEEEPKEIEE